MRVADRWGWNVLVYALLSIGTACDYRCEASLLNF
jgi:hypothetical protein